MGKVSEVEIPDGSGNHYRYEYDESSGKTLYKGPVGGAPALSEEEFLRLSASPEMVAQGALSASLHTREDVIKQFNRIPKDMHGVTFPWHERGLVGQWVRHNTDEGMVILHAFHTKEGEFSFEEYNIKTDDVLFMLHHAEELVEHFILPNDFFENYHALNVNPVVKYYKGFDGKEQQSDPYFGNYYAVDALLRRWNGNQEAINEWANIHPEHQFSSYMSSTGEEKDKTFATEKEFSKYMSDYWGVWSPTKEWVERLEG